MAHPGIRGVAVHAEEAFRRRNAQVPVTGLLYETETAVADMSRVMAGTGERFDELYRAHAPAVLAYCLRRASRDVAEDAAAETFTIAWRRLDDAPVAPLPWLLGIARRVLANQRRSTRRQQALAERIAAQPAAGGDAVVGAPILEILSTLSPADQEVLMLAAWEGLGSAEIAKVLGCTAVAARIRLHRARRRLALALEAEDIDESAPTLGLSAQAKEIG